MLENLLTYERNLFLWLNDCHTPYWDEVMCLYSGKGVWLPLALLFLLTLCYRKYWREIVLVLLAIVLTITLCDQFASHVCKPLFTRFRPTHHPDFMNEVKTVFGYRGGRYGFISSHAANAFGFAMFLALLFRNRWLGFTLFFWATVNAYSRIYLGVHFLTDIIPGIMAGIFFGYIVYKLYAWVRSRWLPDSPSPVYGKRRAVLITSAVWLMFIILLTLHAPLVRMGTS